jgi:hypothetical protein
MNAKSNLRNIFFRLTSIATSEAEEKILQVLDESLTNPEVIILEIPF